MIVFFRVLVFLLLFSFTASAGKSKWDADKSDWSPLMLAVYKGKYKKIEKLLLKNADVNYTSKSGLTPLLVAIRKQDPAAMNILLSTNKVSKNNSEYYVTIACQYKNADVVRILISNGYSVSRDESGYTSLMAASSFGSVEIVKYLIDNVKLNLNEQRNVDGMTALMFAVDSGDSQKVKLLLEAGADRKIPDKAGNTAIKYVDGISPDKKNIKKEIMDLLYQ